MCCGKICTRSCKDENLVDNALLRGNQFRDKLKNLSDESELVKKLEEKVYLMQL